MGSDRARVSLPCLPPSRKHLKTKHRPVPIAIWLSYRSSRRPLSGLNVIVQSTRICNVATSSHTLTARSVPLFVSFEDCPRLAVDSWHPAQLPVLVSCTKCALCVEWFQKSDTNIPSLRLSSFISACSMSSHAIHAVQVPERVGIVASPSPVQTRGDQSQRPTHSGYKVSCQMTY